MLAIFYTKDKKRHTEEMTTAPEEITLIETNTEVSYKVVYKKQFYDNKSRPVYTETERTAIETTFA